MISASRVLAGRGRCGKAALEVQVPQTELLGMVPEGQLLCTQTDSPTLMSQWPVLLYPISLPKREMEILSNGIALPRRGCNSLQFSLLSDF